MDSYVGEIRLMPYMFAPVNWHDCDGSTMPINQYQALYALLGTTYGGDGVTTFGLPDLRGRVPVHVGTNYPLGQRSGTEAVTLLESQMPAHTHAMFASTVAATTGTPSNSVQLGSITTDTLYTNNLDGLSPLPIADTMITSSGGNQPHENCMPTLTLRYCISLFGVYPTQS